MNFHKLALNVTGILRWKIRMSENPILGTKFLF